MRQSGPSLRFHPSRGGITIGVTNSDWRMIISIMGNASLGALSFTLVPVADTTPNLAVHSDCVQPGTTVTLTPLRGIFTCYVCGKPIKKRRPTDG